MKFRVLPVTIIICGLFMVGKTVDLIGTSRADDAPAAKTAAPAAATKPDAAAEDDSAEADSENKPVGIKPKKIEIVDQPEVKKADDKKADAKDGDKQEDKLPNNVSYEKPKENIPEFSDSEKQILEKLADRRAELDARAKDLDMKESLIDASSKKLDEKLEELKKLKADTETILKTYNDHEDAKTKGLVKIYESMKPKDAAAIFEQMDADILLDISDKMADKKLSAILAAMDPKKARDLTEQLATERSLRSPQLKQAAQEVKAKS